MGRKETRPRRRWASSSFGVLLILSLAHASAGVGDGVGGDIFVDGFSERSCLFRPFATSAASDDWKHCPPRPCRSNSTSQAVDDFFYRDKCTPRFAFVTMASNIFHTHYALVLMKSLRAMQTPADLVVVFFDQTGKNAGLEELRQQAEQMFGGVETLRELGVRVLLSPPVVQLDDLTPQFRAILRSKTWDFSKLLAWRLEAYERLVFLDSDMIAVKPADSLFRAPRREMVVTDGPWSRFNAGLMVLYPSERVFEEMLDITLEGNFSWQTGWRGAGLEPVKNGMSYGAESTQGLFYYYFVQRPREEGRRQAMMLPRDVWNLQDTTRIDKSDMAERKRKRQRVRFVHFTYCGKPAPWSIPNGTRAKGETCYAYHKRWLQLSKELSPEGKWLGWAADRRQRLPAS